MPVEIKNSSAKLRLNITLPHKFIIATPVEGSSMLMKKNESNSKFNERWGCGSVIYNGLQRMFRNVRRHIEVTEDLKKTSFCVSHKYFGFCRHSGN